MRAEAPQTCARATNGTSLTRYDGGGDRQRTSEDMKPCCVHHGYGSWCFLPDGHIGAHEGPPLNYDVPAMPEVWRRHKGRRDS